MLPRSPHLPSVFFLARNHYGASAEANLTLVLLIDGVKARRRRALRLAVALVVDFKDLDLFDIA